MIDEGGDGWQGATYAVFSSTTFGTQLEGEVLLSGTLEDGPAGSNWLCLADDCYELVVGGGSADSEIGFAVRDEHGGSFQDLQAPYSDHFCTSAGDIFEHPTFTPTVSLVPTPLPSYAPSALPTPSPTAVPTPLLARAVRASNAEPYRATPTFPDILSDARAIAEPYHDADAAAFAPTILPAHSEPDRAADIVPDRPTDDPSVFTPYASSLVNADEPADACSYQVTVNRADVRADFVTVSASYFDSVDSPNPEPDGDADDSADADAHCHGPTHSIPNRGSGAKPNATAVTCANSCSHTDPRLQLRCRSHRRC